MKSSQLLLIVVIVWLLNAIEGRQKINITVMIPGIDAFKRLYSDALPLPEDAKKNLRSHIDYEYSNDYTTGFDDEVTVPTFTIDVNNHGGDYGEYVHYCIDDTTGDPDVECLLGEYFVSPWSYVFAKPALEVALQTIQDDPNLLVDYDIDLRYYDSGNSMGRALPRSAQIASVDSMMKDHLTAMIGPMDAYSMSRVSSFAAHWDVLNLTPGAISIGLRQADADNTDKDTMVRTGPVAEQVGYCMAAILEHFNWNTTAVEVFEDNFMERYHYFMAEGIYEGVSRYKADFKMTQVRLSEFLHPNTTYDYDTVITKLSTRGRVMMVSADDWVVREFLKVSSEHGHDNGEFVYIILDLEGRLGTKPWQWISLNGSYNEDPSLKIILQSVLIVTLGEGQTPQRQQFIEEVQKRLGKGLFDEEDNSNLSKTIADIMVKTECRKYGAKDSKEYFERNPYPAYLHDSLMMLAQVLNTSMLTLNNSDPVTPCQASSIGQIKRNGRHLLENYVVDKEFDGVTGKIVINKEGDRLFDFAVSALNPNSGEFEVVGKYSSDTKTFSQIPGAKIHWPGGKIPPDVPVCGFAGKKCKKERLTLIEAIVITIVSITMVVGILSVNTYNRHKLKKELESQLWRVYWNDIVWPTSQNNVLGGQLTGDMGVMGGLRAVSEPSLGEVISYYVPSLSPAIAAKRAHKRKRKWSSNSRKERICENERKTSAGSLISDKVWGGLTAIATYRKRAVVVKLMNRRKVELSRSLLMELKHMRDITHEHLTRFEGACVEWPHICILSEYCRKGSLRDILLNEEIQLDWMFRVSLMSDLVKGMSFLHGSAIQSHGSLKSTNCVVDSRFVLKITDFGLVSFRSSTSFEDVGRNSEKKLWTAPELLRCPDPPLAGTQKADVYSFGIILQEIALRKGTFYVGGMHLSCKEIVSKVRNGFRPYFRPLIEYSTINEDLGSLMQRCWNEDPNERPNFNETKKIIEKFNKDNPGNLVENLLHRMEQYAINLETLVEERTEAYMLEKRKADKLLYQMLPIPVVDRLKRGEAVPAESFDSVTICFTDIVGFTSLSAASNPMQIVNLLNDLYTCFDAIIDHFDVYKVETIGDAYMMVSGLPVKNGIRHAAEIARTALALLRRVSTFKIRHRPGDQLKLRIGIHTGSCCAGVVGLKMPRYCLFGDTVNTASRMESSGMPLAIHVSESTKQLLDRFQSFKLQLRGEVPMKGKGTLVTYWLTEEVVYEEPSIEECESLV